MMLVVYLFVDNQQAVCVVIKREYQLIRDALQEIEQVGPCNDNNSYIYTQNSDLFHTIYVCARDMLILNICNKLFLKIHAWWKSSVGI